MKKDTTYLLRGGLVSLAQLALLVAVYITVGWIIVSTNAESLEAAKEQYDAMFPSFMSGSVARQLVALFSSFFALLFAAVGKKHVQGARKNLAVVIMALAAILALLNIYWLL